MDSRDPHLSFLFGVHPATALKLQSEATCSSLPSLQHLHRIDVDRHAYAIPGKRLHLVDQS